MTTWVRRGELCALRWKHVDLEAGVLTVRRGIAQDGSQNGRRYPPRHVKEDIDRPDSFQPHLLAIARMEAPKHTDGHENWIGDFELEIHEPGEEYNDPKLTLRWQKT